MDPLWQAAGPLPDRSDGGFAGCEKDEAGGDLYDMLRARLKREHVPFTVTWELTHSCNLKCVMCYNSILDEPELGTDECLGVLEQLAQAGTLKLLLTGGEILSRRDFFTIAERARALGFALDLKTNGTLITPEIADRLAALHPLQVDISLLGATTETFDAVSGVDHTLRRVLRGVRLMQERGVRVKLNTLLLDLNVHERQAMLDLANELGVYYEQVFKISPRDDGSDAAAVHQLTLDEMTGVLVADRTPFTPRTPTPETRTCSVGLSSCVISPYGVVYPCIELRIPAGDLRQQRFSDVWADGPILRQLRERHSYANLTECRVCPINAYCEGRCAGIAWKEHGDLFGANLLACRQAQARYVQQHPGSVAPQTPLQAGASRRGASVGTRGQPISLIGF
jgi:radical SAM protein with 4Fe4S-binding SPASM domain